MIDAGSFEDLILELGSYAYSSKTFVYWAFPWGEAGTELANFSGPEPWQLDILDQLDRGLVTIDQAIRIAVASGHGIGKSALVSWIILWAFTTFPGTRGVVTANTENQLKTKTWVELSKWFRLFIARDLFKLTATALFSQDEEQAREWRVDIVPWSEKNTEAFAGLHNQGKRILVVFDEASTIHPLIWQTTEGAMTDAGTEIIWVCFGNPTDPDGQFRQCFDGGQFSHRWITREVDSRSVSFSNKKQISDWIADYGIDSDFVRVRILGKFPKAAINSFISYHEAFAAAGRQVSDQSHARVVLGVDVARFGDDLSVILPRQGLDASSRKIQTYTKIPTTTLVSHIIEAYHTYNAVAVVVDETGIGGAVLDQLRILGINCYGVTFNASPEFPTTGIKYYNRRAEIWGAAKDFLRSGSIPLEVQGRNIPTELAGPGYSYTGRDSAIQLESKEFMKKRGVSSPDIADALALTLAFPMLDLLPDLAAIPTSSTPDHNPLGDF